MLLFVDVARSISLFEPLKILTAGLVALRRWRVPRSLTVPGMSVEWLAEHERRSAKQGPPL